MKKLILFSLILLCGNALGLRTHFCFVTSTFITSNNTSQNANIVFPVHVQLSNFHPKYYVYGCKPRPNCAIDLKAKETNSIRTGTFQPHNEKVTMTYTVISNKNTLCVIDSTISIDPKTDHCELIISGNQFTATSPNTIQNNSCHCLVQTNESTAGSPRRPENDLKFQCEIM